MFAPLIPALVGAITMLIGSWVGRALLALGISFVTYKGASAAIASVKTLVIQRFNGMPVDVLNLVGFLALDKAITIILSAYLFRVSIRAAGGVVKKAVLK